MALVDDVEEDVRRVRSVDEVADLVDDEDVRVDEFGEGLAQLALLVGEREPLDELIGAREERLEAVLDCFVGDRDREVRLPRPARAVEDRAASLRDELRAEEAPELCEADRRLEGEVELFDRLQVGEVRLSHGSRDPRLGSVRDLLGEKGCEIVAVRHALGLGASFELGVETAHGR